MQAVVLAVLAVAVALIKEDIFADEIKNTER